MKKIAWLPRFIRQAVLRNSVRIPESFPTQLKFKLAQSSFELDQCFRLYEKLDNSLKVQRPDSQHFLPTIQHALPSTTNLIATWNGNVIATLSLVKDSEFGLPMEDFIDIFYYKKRDNYIAEILGLSIDEDFREEFIKEGYLYAYLKYVFEYCMSVVRVNQLLMIIPDKQVALFEDVLLAGPIQMMSMKQHMQSKKLYGKTLRISFNEKLKEDYYHAFAHYKDGKNLYKFIFNSDLGRENFIFPIRKYYKADDPVLCADLLRKYFLQKTNIFDKLNEEHKQYILMIYNQKQFYRVTKSKEVVAREHYRFKNQLFGKNSNGLPIDVKEISRGGVRVIQNNFLNKDNKVIEFDIQISQTKQARIMAKIVWANTNEAGLKILNACPEWDHYINYLESDLSNGQRFGEEIFAKVA